MQTNGTRLSDEWLAFLRDHDIGVGVSLDGPPEIHDARRVDAAGRPTSARVREGIERMRAAGITRWGVLMVVDGDVCALGPRRVLEYLTEIGVERVSLLNVLPENTPTGTPLQGDYLLLPPLRRVLARAVRALVGRISRPDRCAAISPTSQARSGATRRRFASSPASCFGLYLTIEPTGEVSACDKYIDDDEYRFGHVLESGLAGVQSSERLAAVRRENAHAVERMRDCRWFGVCHGGCPHDHYTASGGCRGMTAAAAGSRRSWTTSPRH